MLRVAAAQCPDAEEALFRSAGQVLPSHGLRLRRDRVVDARGPPPHAGGAGAPRGRGRGAAPAARAPRLDLHPVRLLPPAPRRELPLQDGGARRLRGDGRRPLDGVARGHGALDDGSQCILRDSRPSSRLARILTAANASRSLSAARSARSTRCSGKRARPCGRRRRASSKLGRRATCVARCRLRRCASVPSAAVLRWHSCCETSALVPFSTQIAAIKATKAAMGKSATVRNAIEQNKIKGALRATVRWQSDAQPISGRDRPSTERGAPRPHCPSTAAAKIVDQVFRAHGAVFANRGFVLLCFPPLLFRLAPFKSIDSCFAFPAGAAPRSLFPQRPSRRCSRRRRTR